MLKTVPGVLNLPQTAHVLLVEDDPAVTHMLRATLEYGSFTSDHVGSALEALQILNDRNYDAVLLDLGLPDLDGTHLVKTVRANSEVPIIVVSGRGAEEEKIAVLDQGADDFIAKPFLPGELLARLRAVLRRRPRAHEAFFRQEELVEHSVSPAGGPELRLTTMENKLLRFLHSRAGQVATPEDIAASIWGDQKERGKGHVRVLVAQLRRKLESSESSLQISNERGNGYRLSSLSEVV
jgi:two-component system KDP operon response regulator KdpE